MIGNCSLSESCKKHEQWQKSQPLPRETMGIVSKAFRSCRPTTNSTIKRKWKAPVTASPFAIFAAAAPRPPTWLALQRAFAIFARFREFRAPTAFSPPPHPTFQLPNDQTTQPSHPRTFAPRIDNGQYLCYSNLVVTLSN